MAWIIMGIIIIKMSTDLMVPKKEKSKKESVK
jgi:hypothetical protein